MPHDQEVRSNPKIIPTNLPEPRKLDQVEPYEYALLDCPEDRKLDLPLDLFYTKPQKQDIVNIDEGVMEANFTVGELLIGILMRLANRYTKEEVEYFEKFQKKPILLFNKDGKDGRYYTTTQIQRLTQAWRAQVHPEYRILTEEEFETVEQLADEILNDKNMIIRNSKVGNKIAVTDAQEPSVSNKECNGESYFIDLQEVATLPLLQGYFPTMDGEYKPIPVVPDSGSQVNLISLKTLFSLGYELKDIDTTNKVKINTAAGAGNQAKGKVTLDLHMKAEDGEYYTKPLICVVLDGPLNKFLLGQPGLEKEHNSIYEAPHRKFIIPVYNSAQQRCMPKFIANSMQNQGYLSAAEALNLKKRDHEYTLVSEVPFCVDRLVSTQGMKGLNVLNIEQAEDFVYVDHAAGKDEKGYPRDTKYAYNVTLMKHERTQVEKGRPLIRWEADELSLEEREDILSLLTEQPLPPVDDDMLPYVGRVEDTTIEKIAVCVDDEFAPKPGDEGVPDLAHLSEERARPFKQLFLDHPDAISTHKFDIARCNVPAASIKTIPGQVASDKMKRYGPAEVEIIQSYLEEMLESGQIVEMDPKEDSSGWNHRLLLVHRQDPEAKEFVTAKADKLPHAERLERLRKSCRLVSDVQGLNQITLSEGTMHLQKFSELVPLFNKQMVSTADIRSGFSNVELDYESSLKTAFTFGQKKYRYVRLLQGAKNSPWQFQTRLGMVLNQKDFETFLEENYPAKSGKLHFDKLLILYLDDLSLLGNDDEEHYIMWHYVLNRFSLRGLKLNVKKVHVLKDNVTFLGYNVAPQLGTYGLTTERKSAFQGWQFRADKAYLCSRLCTANYFDSVCFGFKSLTQGLHMLIRQKEMHVKLLHHREFAMFKLMMDIQLDCTIPDLTKPLLITTDASVSCSAACLMQYHPGSGPQDSELKLCAVSTKQFKGTDSGKCILYKEIICFLDSLKSFEYYIRCSTSSVIVFSDASCLSYLHRLKDSNSRLKTASLYMSSFDRISVFHTKGAWLNFLADSLSRITAGMKIEATSSIPRKYLEQIPQIQMDPCMINPRTLFAICHEPLPEQFTNIPARYAQAYAPVKEEEDLVRMTEGETVEKSILDAIVYGHSAIGPDTKVFLNEKGTKVMSQTDFNAISRKYKFPEIKQHLLNLECKVGHVGCVEVKEEIVEQARSLVNKILNFMRYNPEHHNDYLYKLAVQYLNTNRHSSATFYQLISELKETSLYNTGVKFDEELETTLFIPVDISTQTAVLLEAEPVPGPHRVSGALILKNKSQLTIRPGEAKALLVALRLRTKYSVTFKDRDQHSIATHADWEPEEIGLNHTLRQLIVSNTGNVPVIINARETIGKIIIHMNPNGTCCTCERYSDIRFVVADRTGHLEEPVSPTQVSILFAGMVAAQMRPQEPQVFYNEDPDMEESDEEEEETDDPPDPELGTDDEDPEAARADPPFTAEVPGNDGRFIRAPVKNKELNRLLLTGLILRKREVLSDEYLRQLQLSSEHLVEMRQKVLEGTSTSFVLERGVLFFKEGNILRLCLDDVTALAFLDSLHQRGEHSAPKVTHDFFSKNFYNKNLKKLVAQAKTRCAICIFNNPCHREKYVNRPRQKEGYARWDRVHLDQIENLPYCRAGFKYIAVYVDYCTGYTLVEPLRRLRGADLSAATARVMRFMGPCRELVTDFAPCFRSKEFRNVLKSLTIEHNKETPCRPESNGLAEITVKLFRKILTDVVLSYGHEARDVWDQHLTRALLIFNHSPMYSKVNDVSRMDNFFHPEKYKLSHMYNITEDEEMGNLFDYNESLKKIFAAREAARRRYIKEKRNPFQVNQLVTVSLDKSQMKSIRGGSALAPVVQNVFAVKRVDKTSCRTVSLYDQSEQTFDIKLLKPLRHTEMLHCFGRNLTNPGTFERNIYRKRKQPMLFQLVNDKETDEWDRTEGQDHENEQLEADLRALDQLENENNSNLPSSAPATWGDGVDPKEEPPLPLLEEGEENREPEEHPEDPHHPEEAPPSFPQPAGPDTLETPLEPREQSPGSSQYLGPHRDGGPSVEPGQSQQRSRPVVVSSPRDNLITRIEDSMGPRSREASGNAGKSNTSETDKNIQQSSDWERNLRPWISPRSTKRKINYRELDGGDRRKKARNYYISFDKYVQKRSFSEDKPPFRVSTGKIEYDILTDQAQNKLTVTIPSSGVEIHLISIPRWR